MRSRNDKIPIFLMAERGEASAIPIEVMEMVDEFIWTLEDTAAFVGGRVVAAIRRYLEIMLPPLAAALMKFTQEYEYSWHTPGHTGGTAFLKSPVGRIFFDYFGENLLRSDLSISVGSLGSLLDHTGPIGEHEKYAARVFGAHRTYCVTNGTSMSNRVIFMAAVARDQIALCDRNCHKSIEHSLVMTGGIPTYFVPLRNRYGIIGPIPPARSAQGSDQGRDQGQSAGVEGRSTSAPSIRSSRTRRTTGCATTRGAWRSCSTRASTASISTRRGTRTRASIRSIAIATRCTAIRKDHKGPTVFATHSTHKLLAALSQASFLHIRDGRSAIPHSRFNESFMMHASTSPLYPIIVSNDITAAMMDGPGGRDADQRIDPGSRGVPADDGPRAPASSRRRSDWFFRTWNADTVKGRKSGKKVRFEDAPPEWLATDPRRAGCCIPARPGTASAISKTTTACSTRSRCRSSRPESPTRAASTRRGIPATLVTAYLHYRGVEVEKTTDFTILFLFSIGITKGKWGTLLNALLEFKRDYDSNAPLAQVLPHLADRPPEPSTARSACATSPTRCSSSCASRGRRIGSREAFSTLPTPVMTPNAAYQHLVRDEIEHVPLDDLADRVLATSVVPYPPGIPMLMPGESTGADDGPYLGYLRALCGVGQALPRLRPRHSRRRESRRRLLRAVLEGGARARKRS